MKAWVATSRGQALRPFPCQNSQADAGGLPADGLEAVHVAADDAVTEEGLIDAIDRRSGSIGNPWHEVSRDEALTRSVLKDAEIDDDRVLRQPGELAQQIRQGQARQVGHLEPLGVGAESVPRHGLPVPVESRSSGHHGDVSGIRLQSKRELQRLHWIQTAHDAGGVPGHTPPREARLAHAGKDQGCARKQRSTVLDQEIQRLRTKGNRQVDRDGRILLAKEHRHPGGVLRSLEPVGIEEFGEDLDAIGIAGLEARLKAGAEDIVGRQQALARKQHQDALRLRCRRVGIDKRQNRERDQPRHRAPYQQLIAAVRFACPPHGSFHSEARRVQAKPIWVSLPSALTPSGHRGWR